jgi:hypothetical protein
VCPTLVHSYLQARMIASILRCSPSLPILFSLPHRPPSAQELLSLLHALRPARAAPRCDADAADADAAHADGGGAWRCPFLATPPLVRKVLLLLLLLLLLPPPPLLLLPPQQQQQPHYSPHVSIVAARACFVMLMIQSRWCDRLRGGEGAEAGSGQSRGV